MGTIIASQIIVVVIVSPPSLAEEHMMETCKGGRGCGGNCLGVDTAPLPCCGRACKASKRMFSWSSLSTTSLKTVFFCKNGHSYKKNKKWRSSVHIQLKSMCTDDCQLMNQSTSAAGKRTQFCDHGGGAISMVSKNWKLFVARLSGLWLRKVLLDCPKEKIFPAKTKKWRERMGQTP